MRVQADGEMKDKAGCGSGCDKCAGAGASLSTAAGKAARVAADVDITSIARFFAIASRETGQR